MAGSLFAKVYFYKRRLILCTGLNRYLSEPLLYYSIHDTLKEEDYSEYFKSLNINEESDQSAARDSFIKLAKKYHPDSGHSLADTSKFKEIEIAYRKVLEKLSKDRNRHKDCEGEFGLYYDKNKSNDEEKIFDIKHTAPQHRQYLSYEGIGIGTPAQREKQFTKYKAMKAAENVIDYKVQKLHINTEETSLVKDKKAARKIRTRYGIDRLVEDKIQESMARGDFDNLPNAGKPLKYQNHNPFVDTVTYKLNQVLIDNGYAPEWVMLEKEIRDDKKKIKQILENTHQRLGPYPLARKEQCTHNKIIDNLTIDINKLNKKIDKYNFLVPLMSKQTIHFNIYIESQKILEEVLAERVKQSDDSHSRFNEEQIVGSTSNINENEFSFKSIIKIFKGR